jgi:hypothetical protein
MWSALETVADVIAEAWWELKRARLRTYLALLGITVGAVGLTILICTLHLENALRPEQDVTEIDIRMPSLGLGDYDRTLFPRRPRLKHYELTAADGEAIARECKSVDQAVIRGVVAQADVKGNNWHQAWLTSTNITRLDLFQYVVFAPKSECELVWGRVFRPEEIAGAARVVVIDQRMGFALWPKSQRALGNGQLGGQFIHINGTKFEVIGVLRADRGSGVAVIPYTTMQRLFWNATWHLSAIPKPGSVKAAAGEIDRVLLRRIGDPGCPFAILPGVSYEELKVYLFFGIVGGLVLLAAGAAVSNKAYIDALERVQQFAVRRALGATKQRICAVVLIESALICGFGCLYGGAIGWMVFATFSAEKWILHSLWYALPVLPLGAVFLAVIALGVAGSVQGAAVAGRANPADVLARRDIV